MEENGKVLEMRNICKSFPGVKALQNVSLTVYEGRVHALVGENGAGKSTLMKILSGVYEVDAGEIVFKGKSLKHQDIKEIMDLGIAMIHQELSPLENMTIAENLFLGKEPSLKIGCFVDFKAMHKDARRMLEDMGLSYDPARKMRSLSIADMQLIEITKAIHRGASLIIMDEPTSAITSNEIKTLFEHIRKLKEQGTAIVYISHKFDEIFEIADDVTVLRDGQYICSGEIKDYTEADLIARMVGRKIDNYYPKEQAKIGETVLKVKNLNRNGAFRDISFEVKKGEIVGIFGLVGAGRTEVLRAIFGLDELDSGEIELCGRKIKKLTTDYMIRQGVAMVSEDRRTYGIIPRRSVEENITLTFLKKFMNGVFTSRKKENAVVKEMIQELLIKTPDEDALIQNLSGGNQQKVVLAKWLLGDLKVLMLDEPTRGIDVGAKSEIYRIISQLAGKGVSVIMVSSELPEILGMSDRIIVMHEKTIVGELNVTTATQEGIMTMATGGRYYG